MVSPDRTRTPTLTKGEIEEGEWRLLPTEVRKAMELCKCKCVAGYGG
jgi:hypothetical protein